MVSKIKARDADYGFLSGFLFCSPPRGPGTTALITALPEPSCLSMSCFPCLGSSGDPLLTFANSPSNAIGDSKVPQSQRVYFGIFLPEEVEVRPVHMFFDRTKGTGLVLEAAARHARLTLDRGRLVGSPERLNLFTIDGDALRTDLDLDAHLGGALHPSSILVLEKGNRISDERLDLIKVACSQQAAASACTLL